MSSNLNPTQTPLFLDAPSPDTGRSPHAAPPQPSADPTAAAVRAKLQTAIAASGEFQLPCLPSMSEQYRKLVRGLMKVLGQDPTAAEMRAFEAQLTRQLDEGFARSPQSYLTLRYAPVNPEAGLSGGLTLDLTLGDAPAERQSLVTAKSSRFGRYPDAKAMAIAAELGDGAAVPVLDIGAGIGRNSLPLAKRGHPVDAIATNPQAAQQLQTLAQSRGLRVNLLSSDALDRDTLQPTYRLAIAPEVLPHLRSTAAVGQFFRQVTRVLVPGGVLLVGAFLTQGNYRPDAKVRELAQTLGCCIVERSQLQSFTESLPLTLTADESVVGYESRHLPPEAWLPSETFLTWANGRELFPTLIAPPIEFRWLQFQRQ